MHFPSLLTLTFDLEFKHVRARDETCLPCEFCTNPFNSYRDVARYWSGHILIQNEQLAQVNTFPYLGSLIMQDGECMTEFRTRLSRGQAIGASLQKIWKSHSIPISTKVRLMKALVWPVVTYGCESWTLRKNEETRLEHKTWT